MQKLVKVFSLQAAGFTFPQKSIVLMQTAGVTEASKTGHQLCGWVLFCTIHLFHCQAF